MPLGNPLIDPRMVPSLVPQMWRSECAVYDTDDAANAIGEVTRIKQAAPVAGLERIRCNISQVLGQGADINEMRTPGSTFVAELRECQLDSYYGGIEEDMVAVVDGVQYDIRGVKQASVRSHTVLILERIR